MNTLFETPDQITTSVSVFAKPHLVRRNDQPSFLFIVGCGHSGTSLLNRILSTRHQIFAIGGETGLFYWPQHNHKRINNTLKEWRCQASNNHNFILDKTPKHVRRLAKIWTCLPEARVIAVTRNPLDTVASLYQRFQNLPFAIQRYECDNRKILTHKKGRTLSKIKYEDIITNFNTTLNEACEHLGLTPEDLSRFHEHETYFEGTTTHKPTLYSQ